jgi:hypothetical protein
LLTCYNDALAGSFYKRHAISPWLLKVTVTSDCCEYVVSGSLSSPSRGPFHLSLTVLVHYRSLEVFSLGEWSPQLPTRLHVSRGTQDPGRERAALSLRDSHPLRSRFPTRSSLLLFFVACPTTPVVLPTHWFGLLPVRSPLLRESRLISSRRVTEMFQFTRCPPPHLCVQ